MNEAATTRNKNYYYYIYYYYYYYCVFLVSPLPLLLFKTMNTRISNSAIILTLRSNTFQPDMVAHLVRKFSAFCSTKLHVVFTTGLQRTVFWACSIPSYDLRYILIYPLCNHAHLKLYSNMYYISHARYVLSPSQHSWFDRHNNSGCRIQIKGSPFWNCLHPVLISFLLFSSPFSHSTIVANKWLRFW
jgi:hypothetical protein